MKGYISYLNSVDAKLTATFCVTDERRIAFDVQVTVHRDKFL